MDNSQIYPSLRLQDFLLILILYYFFIDSVCRLSSVLHWGEVLRAIKCHCLPTGRVYELSGFWLDTLLTPTPTGQTLFLASSVVFQVEQIFIKWNSFALRWGHGGFLLALFLVSSPRLCTLTEWNYVCLCRVSAKREIVELERGQGETLSQFYWRVREAVTATKAQWLLKGIRPDVTVSVWMTVTLFMKGRVLWIQHRKWMILVLLLKNVRAMTHWSFGMALNEGRDLHFLQKERKTMNIVN